ncbi:hypothetical protein LCGC14_2060350, partial [marine sediment metagenome]
MEVGIVGAGLSGCTAAHKLAMAGHKVFIYDDQQVLGGLARTATTKYCKIYEPFGNHSFHTKKKSIWDWINSFVDFRIYEHRKGIMLFNDIIYPYPLHTEDIQNKFPIRIATKIYHELKNVTHKKGRNFRECVVDMIGPTLYSLTVENYTRSQWGCDPEMLLPDWAPKRIEIRDDDDDRLFRDEYQGVPKLGYTFLCSRITAHKNINVFLNIHIDTSMIRKLMDKYDIVLC